MPKIKRLLFLGAAVSAVIGGAVQAGPVNPPAGNAVQNSSVPQVGQFNISSATVRGQVTVGSIKFPDGTIQVSSAPATSSVNIGTSTINATKGINTSTITVGSLSGVLKATTGNVSGSATTTDLPEGSNQYFTTARSTSAVSASSPLTYSNGVFSAGSSSFTLQGNSFNGANQLLKLNSSAFVPNASIDTSSVTKLGPTITLGQQTIGIFVASVTATAPLTGSGTGTGKAITLGIDASSVTLMGNTFNGNSQLVKTDSSGRLPAINASQLTNLPASPINPGSTNYIQNTLDYQTNAEFNVKEGVVQNAMTAGSVTSNAGLSGLSLFLQTANPNTDNATLQESGGANGYSLLMYKSSGTFIAPSNVSTGDELGNYLWNAYAANNWRSAGGIRAFVDTGSLLLAAPSEMLFYTQDGTNGSDLAHLAIRANGQVRIGPNINGSETQTSALHVDGTIGTGYGINTSTLTLRSQGAGIAHVVAASSNVVSGLVSLSTEVTGVLPTANGGTGQSTYQDGDLLIGNTATGGLVSTTLLPGPNVQIVNGNGTITVGAPQLSTAATTSYFPYGLHASTGVFTSSLSASNFSGVSSGTNSGDVSIGTGNGLSIGSQVLSMATASASQNGALTSTDWTRFNTDISSTTGSFAASTITASYISVSTISSRTLWINVMAPPFGAKGDGVTDDTLAIQNAICSATATVTANAAGAVVHFPYGRYRITSQISITTNNVTLQGDYGGSSQIYMSTPLAAAPFMIVVGTGTARIFNVHIRGLNFYGSANSRTWTFTGGVEIVNTSHCSIEDCVFEKLSSVGIGWGRYSNDNTTYTDDITVSNNVVRNTYSDGISGQVFAHARVYGNYVENTGVDGNNYPLLFEGISESVIENNISSHTSNGMVLNNNGTTARADTVISNNQILFSNYNGIYLDGAYGVTLNANSIVSPGALDATSCGILLNDDGGTVVPSNNRGQEPRYLVSGNLVDRSTGSAICSSINGALITGNFLSNGHQSAPFPPGAGSTQQGAQGIFLFQNISANTTPYYNIVSNNVIYNTQNTEGQEANGSWNYCIEVTTSAVGNILINNSCRNMLIGTIADFGTSTVLLQPNGANYGIGLSNAGYALSVKGQTAADGLEIQAQAPKIAFTDLNGGQQSGSLTYDNGQYSFNNAVTGGVKINPGGDIAAGSGGTFGSWDTFTGSMTVTGSTIAYSAAVVSGTKTDNSTTTYTGANSFANGISVSSAPGKPTVFNVGQSSITIGEAAYIHGTNTNDTANYTDYGFYGSTTAQPGGWPATTGNWGGFVSTTVAAGDWDFTGIINWGTNGATVTDVEGCISTASGSCSSAIGDGHLYIGAPILGQLAPGTISNFRVTVAAGSTQQIFLDGFSTFTGGPPSAYVRLSWRRAR